MGRLKLGSISSAKGFITALVLIPALAWGLAALDNLQVDNVNVNGNTISTTNTNGDLTLDMNGTGSVLFADLTATTVPYLDASKQLTSSAVTPTELGYLSGVTSAVQTQLDARQSRATLTTKGDLYVATASATVARQGVGADGLFLKADSTQTNGVAWASAASANVAVTSIASTDTAELTDDVILLSGATFTLTLYDCTSTSVGKVLTLIHNGTSLSQVYTIDGDGGDTIAGAATVAMHTNGQSLKIVCSTAGGAWLVLESKTETAWVDAGAVTIGAVTTPPTKPTGITVDKFYWKREGTDLVGRYEYKQSNTTSAAAGSGDYLFPLVPSGATIDTTKLTAYTSGDLRGTNSVGGGHGQGSGNAGLMSVVVYDSGNVRLQITTDGGTSTIGSASFALTASATLTYTAYFRVPITDWLP